MTYNRAQMKQNAKATMKAVQPKAWLVTLVFLAILTLVPMGVNALANTLSGMSLTTFSDRLIDLLEDIEFARPEQLISIFLSFIGVSAAVSMVTSIIITVFRTLMNYGYAGYNLQAYCRESRAGIGSLFLGFPRFGPVILSALLVWCFSFLWGLLFYGLTVVATVLLASFVDSDIVGLLVILLFVAAVVAHSLITLRYILTPYFVMSRNLDASASVKASTRAMKGNIWKRFVLELSFLGWQLLLGLICFLAALICFLLATFVSGGAIIDLVEQITDYPILRDLSGFVEQLISGLRGIVMPYVVATVVTTLAQLPMQLWLMTYKNLAYAGFFQEIVGSQNQDPIPVAVAVGGQPTPPSAPDIPAPAAPVVPTPVAPDAPPAAPAYTPFDKEPTAPQAPAPVEEAAAPETPPIAPAAPETPPIAPVVPETPPVPPETPPITPEGPEG